MIQKLFQKSPLFLSKERLKQMLIVLEKEESIEALKELLALMDTSPELVPKESIFKIINHDESLKTIKECSIRGIKEALEGGENTLEEEMASYFRHFWAIREMESLSSKRDFSSIKKVRGFIQKTAPLLEMDEKNRVLLHSLEDVQKVIEEGASLRKKNKKDLEESVEEVLSDAKDLEKEFEKLPSSLKALLDKIEWIDLRKELEKAKENGASYLQEVDRVIGYLSRDFSKEEKPINKCLGFSWGVFLHPFIESLEPEVTQEKIEDELSSCSLYQDVVRARDKVEKNKVYFMDWIEKKEVV